MEKRDFFVSYNKRDEDWAKRIAQILEKKGYSVHIQVWDIRPSDDFIEKMNEFFEGSKGFIAVASDNYFKSQYCKKEWQVAFDKNIETEGTYRFFAFRIHDIKMPELTRTTVRVDLFNLKDNEIEEKIAHTVDITPIPRKIRPIDITSVGGLPRNNLTTRNSQFSGREAELSRIRKAFDSHKAAVCIKQTIAGLGGVGKTQLALEYAHRYGSEYTDAIWWMVTENAAQAREEMLKFAEAVGLTDKNDPQLMDDELIRRLNGWFDSHHSFLLIFDNVEQAGDIAPYLSHAMSGHVLVTTRDHSLDIQGAEPMDLNVFPPPEAAAFMRECLPDTAIDSEDSLETLTRRLGYLPLALKQAAAYMKIKANDCDCAGYLELLKENGLTIFDDSAVPDYNSIVTTTWKASIEKTGEPARQLLNLCAYMAPDSIPLEFFKRQRASWPEPLRSMLDGTMNVNKVIRGLTRYALAKRDGGVLHMHRLVQDVVRWDARDGGTDWLALCLDAMIDAMPRLSDYGSRAPRDWFEQTAAHAAAIAAYAENEYADDADKEKRTAFLNHLLGVGSQALARYNQALVWFQKELSIYEKALGTEHPSTATTYNNMASVYHNQEDYPEALEWYHKALAIKEKVLGTEHPSTATTYNNIASVYEHQGDCPKALEWYQKASAICEKMLGTEHPHTAATYNNIAGVYRHQGDYPKALEWYQKDLAISEKVLGTEHPDTATTYNNIASVYNNQGDYPKAMEWHQKALAIREKVLGTEHPDTAATYNNIAGFYKRQGDYPKALEWYSKSYRIVKRVLGDAHLSTKTVKRNMERTYEEAALTEPFAQWLQENFPG